VKEREREREGGSGMGEREHEEMREVGVPSPSLPLHAHARPPPHSSSLTLTCVIWRDSWLPRSSVTRDGCRALSSNSSVNVSRELKPRSTKSPMKTYEVDGTSPPVANSFSRSWNWPWMSPQTWRERGMGERERE